MRGRKGKVGVSDGGAATPKAGTLLLRSGGKKLVSDSFVSLLIRQNYEDEMVYGNGFGGGDVDGLHVLLKRRGFNCSTC